MRRQIALLKERFGDEEPSQLRELQAELKILNLGPEKYYAKLQSDHRASLAKFREELKVSIESKIAELRSLEKSLEQQGTKASELAKRDLAMLRAEVAQLSTTYAKLYGRLNQTQPSPTLLYDNKTFDQWRALWKNELKTEKRTEAIKAMAAFGRAGYGKEAAEAILDVAGEYDFYMRDSSAEGQLKEQLLEILNDQSSHGLSPSLWIDDLLDRYAEDQKRWKWLAWNAISQVKYANQSESTQDQLLNIAMGKDKFLRGAALTTVGSAKVDNAAVRKLAEEIVASDDKQQLYDYYWLLVAHRQSSFGGGGGGFGGGGMSQPVSDARSLPAIIGALKYPDLKVRRRVRSLLGNLSAEDAQKIVDAMLETIKTASDDVTRIVAIRTLSALGQKGESATEPLKETLRTGSDSVQVAAAAALHQLGANDGKAWLAMHRAGISDWSNLKILTQEQNAQVSVFYEAVEDAFANELELLLPVTSNPGGGMGGGGGGFF